MKIEDVKQWIQKYTPILLLYPGDIYFPSTADWFLSRAELVYTPLTKSAKNQSKILIPAEHCTIEEVLKIQSHTENAADTLSLRLPLDSDRLGPINLSNTPNQSQLETELAQIPVYAHVRLIEGESESILEIIYMTFFAYNGEYALCGLPLIKAGMHDGDWEHVTVRIDAKSGEFYGIYYNSHRNCEGHWRNSPTLIDKESNRICSYIAKAGHGHYEKHGTVFRLFGIANDKCSEHGPRWKPSKCIVVTCMNWTDEIPSVNSRGKIKYSDRKNPRRIENMITNSSLIGGVEVELGGMQEWLKFEGAWGTSVAPNRQNWFIQAEHPKSLTPFRRMFLPCTA